MTICILSGNSIASWALGPRGRARSRPLRPISQLHAQRQRRGHPEDPRRHIPVLLRPHLHRRALRQHARHLRRRAVQQDADRDEPLHPQPGHRGRVLPDRAPVPPGDEHHEALAVWVRRVQGLHDDHGDQPIHEQRFPDCHEWRQVTNNDVYRTLTLNDI